MTDHNKPETLDDADLDATGGVYVQEIPSGVKPGRGNGILFSDEGDTVKQPERGWAVFEPNNHR